MRRNYSPYLTEETKELIKKRNFLKEKSTKEGDKEAEKEAKKKGKEIKRAIKADEMSYYERNLSDLTDTAVAWRTARGI